MTLGALLWRPVLDVYPKETVVAEKYQAVVALGQANSRMKDFHDLWTLARSSAFDGPTLADAMGATFERPGMALATDVPLALTSQFARDSQKVEQWRAFLGRGRLPHSATLTAIVDVLHTFLMPPTEALTTGEPFPMLWPLGGPWQPAPAEEAGRR